MYNFDHIVNWKLLQGSHDFPGPDGGTCINEAAIIAAGFEYKKVLSHNDCPPCFSSVLSQYAIGVNDLLPDNERQQLMKFVLRLSGSADTTEVEQKRAKYIAEMTIRKILPLALRHVGLNKEADRCEAEGTKESALAATDSIAALYAASAASAALDTLAADAADAASYAANAASAALDARATDVAIRTKDILNPSDISKMYKYLIEILEGAFAIGNQSTLADVCKVNERLETAKQLVKENS